MGKNTSTPTPTEINLTPEKPESKGVGLVLPETKKGVSRLKLSLTRNGKAKSYILTIEQWKQRGNWNKLTPGKKEIFKTGKLASEIAREIA